MILGSEEEGGSVCSPLSALGSLVVFLRTALTEVIRDEEAQTVLLFTSRPGCLRKDALRVPFSPFGY